MEVIVKTKEERKTFKWFSSSIPYIIELIKGGAEYAIEWNTNIDFSYHSASTEVYNNDNPSKIVVGLFTKGKRKSEYRFSIPEFFHHLEKCLSYDCMVILVVNYGKFDHDDNGEYAYYIGCNSCTIFGDNGR